MTGKFVVAKFVVAMALVLGTSAFAQQTNNPTAPSNPVTPHTDPIQNQAECWDAAAKRVRNPSTVGQNPGTTPSAPQNAQVPGDTAASNSRPPGMKNC